MNAPLKVKHLDNLDIVCQDLDLMARFYHETLGLPFFLPYEPGQGWASLDTGSVAIFLLEGNGDPPGERRQPEKSEVPPALDSLGFAVDDLDAAVAALDGKVTWAAAPKEWRHEASGTWYRFRTFWDPENNLLSVTEPHKNV